MEDLDTWMQSVPISHFCLKPDLQSKYVANSVTFGIRFLVLCYLPFCINLWPPWNITSSFYQMAISLLASVALWFLHCFHQISLALFVLLSSVYGKGSSNFRSKLIYISHKPGICLPSLINYLHWKD